MVNMFEVVPIRIYYIFDFAWEARVRKMERTSKAIVLKSAYEVPKTRRTTIPNVMSDAFIGNNLSKRFTSTIAIMYNIYRQ